MDSQIVKSLLLCNHCHSLPSKSIYECIYCGLPCCIDCKSNKKQCSECNSSSYTISKYGEILLSQLPIVCNLCHKQVQSSRIEYHTNEECDEIEVMCSFTSCKIAMKRGEVAYHLLTSHEDLLYEYIKNPKNNFVKQSLLSITNSQSDIKKDNKNTFLQAFPFEFSGSWFNSSRKYIHINHNNTNEFFTFTSLNPVSGYYSFKVLIKSSQSIGHIVIGLSNRYIHEKKNGYLGGDYGVGTWGLAGNGSIGENGKWTKGTSFKEGGILEIIYNNGLITYSVNGVKTNYSYNSNLGNNVYLGATVYYMGVELEIL